MKEIMLYVLKRIKIGAKYNYLVRQTTKKHINTWDNKPELITGATIKYVAQSTFHTVK